MRGAQQIAILCWIVGLVVSLGMGYGLIRSEWNDLSSQSKIAFFAVPAAAAAMVYVIGALFPRAFNYQTLRSSVIIFGPTVHVLTLVVVVQLATTTPSHFVARMEPAEAVALWAGTRQFVGLWIAEVVCFAILAIVLPNQPGKN